jgi:lysophospholipase L1-like esterase
MPVFPSRSLRRAVRLAPIGAVLFGLIFVARSMADDGDDFARWEPSIAKFEMQDRAAPPPQGAVLFVGSSSIVRWDVAKSFPDRAVINRGFGGSQLADSVHFADRIVLKHKPRTVVLYAGDNDITRGKSPERVHADFQAFVKKIHAELPETRILFLAIKPSINRWNLVDKMRQANELIETTCRRDKRLDYVDVFTPMLSENGPPDAEWFVADGLHLSPTGYELWTAILEPHLTNDATGDRKP